LIQNPSFSSGSLSPYWSAYVNGSSPAPLFYGLETAVTSFGDTYAFQVNSSSLGTVVVLAQNVTGLTVGVQYSFVLPYLFSNYGDSTASILCSINNGVGLNNDVSPDPGSSQGGQFWDNAPSFYAGNSSGLLQCYFIAGDAISIYTDNISLSCNGNMG
jgi:hypothetical protein